MWCLRREERTPAEEGGQASDLRLRGGDDSGLEYAESGNLEVPTEYAVKKPKTKAQADRERDLRLQRTYGINSEEYDKLLESNNGNCWICGFPPSKNRLAVEHDHAYKKAKIIAVKSEGLWLAEAEYNGFRYAAVSAQRSDAVRQLRGLLLRGSIRGLACPWCNRALRFVRDRAEVLRNAAQYLDNFLAGKTRELLRAT